MRINESYRKMFPNNCPVIEVNGDCVEVGTCTYYMPDGVCPRHGRVSLRCPSPESAQPKGNLNNMFLKIYELITDLQPARERKIVMPVKYVKGEYYWLDKEKTILSQCVRIENEVAYFQIIGLSVFYTEKDFEIAIKATVK